jgi:hypothetical protein
MSPRKAKEPIPETTSAPAVTHTIALQPADWFRATWRDLAPLKRPEPAPFDLDGCVKRLSRVTARSDRWVWEKAELAESLTVEEARFWYAAMVGATDKVKPKELALHLGRRSFDVSPTVAEVKKKLRSHSRFRPAELMLPLAHLFTLDEVLDVLRSAAVAVPTKSYWDFRQDVDLCDRLFQGFRRYVRPYLTTDEVGRLRDQLELQLDPGQWPLAFPVGGAVMPTDVRLASTLGMHAEMGQVVHALQEALRSSHYPYQERASCPRDAIFGLGDPGQVKHHMQRLELSLADREDVFSWLAHTELGELALVRDSILAAHDKPTAEALLRAFSLVRAPEAAPLMLELKLRSKVPALARQWLDEQTGNAIAGLIPLATGRGKLADEARAYLREARRQGHGNFLEEQLEKADPEVAAKVRRDVLEKEERTAEVFDEATTPEWLRDAVAETLGGRPAKPPEWARLTNLPQVLVEERALNEEQLNALLAALRKSTPEKPEPLARAIKEKGDPASLDAFAWALFELWCAERTPAKDKWALLAIGILGGDGSALKLTPHIRNWPQQRQHQRAVTGLECLRAIGSDTALMQLNTIAQKQGKALQVRAQQCMAEIASERGLSMGQLEDRIVPDLGLDERGSRVFDLGPRRFWFVLGPGLKPQVRDEAGKVKANLPKPGAKDDPDKAETAVREWNLLKAQVREAVKAQAHRLEQAMVNGRRWRSEEFETYLVRHPLLTHLVRLLLWGGYDKQGKLLRAFRVTEDQEYADVEDHPCGLDGLPLIGIVHPVQLSDEERSRWGQVFGDYELIAPFPQLGRRFHRLGPGEENLKELTRFGETSVELMVALGILKRHGWGAGYWGEDRGETLTDHNKPFPGAGVTAAIHLGASADRCRVEKVYFLKGLPGKDLNPARKLPLGEVDPVVLSEVLGTAGVLASKGS